MDWSSEFTDRIEHQVPIAPLTWFRLGGPAKLVFHPTDADDLSRFLRRTCEENVPVKVLGAGANVLVSDDGFDGVVIRLDSEGFKRVEREEGGTWRVGAGVDLMPLCKSMSRNGFSGLSGLAGIPATIGGAVRMNAGGRFGEMSEVVSEARVIDQEGVIETWTREQLGFGYRRSRVGDRIVTDAVLTLSEDDPARSSREHDECLAFKRQTQPLGDNSAGCIFKNPQGQSAGALIDRAGLKGVRRGGAYVSERHANFIVADRNARARDVIELIDHVRDRVRREFDTELETEIDIW